MDYKTVMVTLALDRANDACLAVAGDLAERFDARVIGVAASDIRPTLYFAEGDYAQKILEEEGLPTASIYMVAGRADTQPLFPDDPSAAANRRVTITLMREAPALPPDLKP